MGSTTFENRGFCPNCDEETDLQSTNDNDDTGTHTACLQCETDIDTYFIEAIYEIAFGDNAINRDFSQKEVIEKIQEYSDNALHYEQSLDQRDMDDLD